MCFQLDFMFISISFRRPFQTRFALFELDSTSAPNSYIRKAPRAPGSEQIRFASKDMEMMQLIQLLSCWGFDKDAADSTACFHSGGDCLGPLGPGQPRNANMQLNQLHYFLMTKTLLLNHESYFDYEI